jgi:hypothetical protein
MEKSESKSTTNFDNFDDFNFDAKVPEKKETSSFNDFDNFEAPLPPPTLENKSDFPTFSFAIDGKDEDDDMGFEEEEKKPNLELNMNFKKE